MSNGSLKKYFVGISIISLRERTDRQSETRRALLKIGQPLEQVEWFLAERPIDAGGFRSKGFRGAFESHLAVLTLAHQRNMANILVLEDDIAFPKDFGTRVQELEKMPDDWDLLYLGHMPLHPEKKSPRPSGWRRLPPDEELIGTHCYAVDSRLLKRIVDEMPNFALSPREHPDGGYVPPDGVLNLIRRRSPDLRCFAAEPPLAHQRPSSSDVGGEHVFDSAIAKQLLETLRRIKGRILYK